MASAEVCDGEDNDCDGAVDEGLAKVSCGVGICGRKIAACAGGKQTACDPKAGAAARETCGNDLDDDCDGLVDEGCTRCSSQRGTPCMTSAKGVCAAGEVTCPDGEFGDPACASKRKRSAEICDGLDNDCDGRTDEGLGKTKTCGVGACAHQVSSCLDGAAEECDPLAGSVDEVCDNGVDDDCNGRTDEQCEACTLADDCDDGDPCSQDVCSETGACTSVPLCAEPQQCVQGECVAAGDQLGDACEDDAGCASGHCADGVCCAAGCEGACRSCLSELTGEDDGTCAPNLAATDPEDECEDEGQESCGQDGLCDGAGACRTYEEGSSCSNDRCTMASSDMPDLCDGKGSCVEGDVTMCKPGYACVGFACRDACTRDSDCLADHHCVDDECVPDLRRGKACEDASHCQSNACVDGVCCDSACAGTCRSCSAAGKGYGVDGLCEPVARGADPQDECETEGGSCGAPGVCDGSGSCQRHASESTACGSTRCQDGQISGSLCDGSGRCAQGEASCGAYTCDGAVCETGCRKHADCAPQAFCTAAGTCAPRRADGGSCGANAECENGDCQRGRCCEGDCAPACEEGAKCDESCESDADCPAGSRCADGVCARVQGVACADDSHIMTDDGETMSCFQYRCEDAACLIGCTTDAQCAKGNHCVAARDAGTAESTGACVSDDEAGQGEDKGGCAAASAGSHREGPAPWLLVFGLLLTASGVWRVRRRQPKPSARPPW